MSRWKVAQHVQYRSWLAYPASYDSEQPESNMDDDLPRQPLARGFRKWQDALAYADRMARTRQVVLPRPQLNKDGKIEFDFTEWAGLDYEPALGDKAVYELRTGPGPRFGERDVLIPREHWRPLAAALWALAEQEESCEK